MMGCFDKLIMGFIALVFITITASTIITISSEKEPVDEGNYTIFVGSPAFSVGHYAYNFSKRDSMITFIKVEDSTEVTVPMCKIHKIRTN